MECCQNCSHGKCKEHSRIKMVVLLNWRGKHLKRNNANPVFYNFINDNKKNAYEIIKLMLTRLEGNYRGQYNFIQFYDNSTGERIFQTKP